MRLRTKLSILACVFLAGLGAALVFISPSLAVLGAIITAGAIYSCAQLSAIGAYERHEKEQR